MKTTTTKYNLLRNFYKNIYENEKAEYLKDTEDPKKLKKELKYLDKKYNNLLNELDKIENFSLEDFKDMSLHIDWKKSATWGANPIGKLTVFHNKEYSLEFYENTYKISGCGYCKTSTCTADLFNQSYVIKKLVLDKVEKLLSVNTNVRELKGLISKDRLELREFIDYGISQYGLGLPKFDEGVGVESHESILKKLGLSMRKINWTSNSDTWIISTSETK